MIVEPIAQIENILKEFDFQVARTALLEIGIDLTVDELKDRALKILQELCEERQPVVADMMFSRLSARTVRGILILELNLISAEGGSFWMDETGRGIKIGDKRFFTS